MKNHTRSGQHIQPIKQGHVDVSVIIINKKERGVNDTLRLLNAQKTDSSFETIVVDASNGSLDDIYDSYPQIRVISFESKSKKRVTIPEQRNVGVKAAKGAVIVFIDASCEPASSWLQKLIDPIMTSGESITAGGTLSSNGKTFHDIVYNAQQDATYIDQAPTINFAIKQAVFKKIGYFDENLRYGSDMDFTWRARSAGFKIRNVSKALITHDWGSMRAELKRANHYGQAKTILYRKHRYGLMNLMKREFTMFFYIGFTIGLVLTFWIPFYPLLILIPILKNIRTNPFKLVAVNFVTAYGAAEEFLRT